MNKVSKELRDKLFNVRVPSWALRAADEIDRLEAALYDIGSYPEGDIVDGTFDEPHSARKARAALKVGRHD